MDLLLKEFLKALTGRIRDLAGPVKLSGPQAAVAASSRVNEPSYNTWTNAQLPRAAIQNHAVT